MKLNTEPRGTYLVHCCMATKGKVEPLQRYQKLVSKNEKLKPKINTVF